jgi:hypothetical protein
MIIVILLILIAFVLSQFERVRTNVVVYRIVVGALALLVLLVVLRWLWK